MLVALPRSWRCQHELKLVLELKEAYIFPGSAPEHLEQGEGDWWCEHWSEEGSSGQRHEHTYIVPLMGFFLHSNGVFLAVLLFAAPFASSE